MVFGIVSGMTLKIDKAGRIVLPKAVRDRLHLREGSELRLLETENGVTLMPLHQEPSMVLKDGIWVHLGKLPPGLNWETLVEDAREERIKEVLGL
jgi:AbrB family looped-hinge helix DNA binding protein